jgi:hypothetical protein
VTAEEDEEQWSCSNPNLVSLLFVDIAVKYPKFQPESET